jgi:hypothetical protein
MCHSLKLRSNELPRWPEVPNATRCAAPPDQASGRVGGQQLGTLPSSTPHWSKESMFQIAPCVNTLCS